MTDGTRLLASPLRDLHRSSSRFERRALERELHADRLYGEREQKWPMLALQSSPDLGNCRHALSQMVVAGTMDVRPPIHVSSGRGETEEQRQSNKENS